MSCNRPEDGKARSRDRRSDTVISADFNTVGATFFALFAGGLDTASATEIASTLDPATAAATDTTPGTLLSEATTNYTDANQLLAEIPSGGEYAANIATATQFQDQLLQGLGNVGSTESALSWYDDGVLSDLLSPGFTSVDQGWDQVSEAALSADQMLESAVATGSATDVTTGVLDLIGPEYQALGPALQLEFIDVAAHFLTGGDFTSAADLAAGVDDVSALDPSIFCRPAVVNRAVAPCDDAMRPRQRVVATFAVILAVLIVAMGRLSGTATADDEVLLGGGASIMVAGSYCTLTTIGHDSAGELVGFTASSCGGPGAPVVAEGADNHGPVGTVAAAEAAHDLDYAVIKFDPAKVVPTANFAGFAINGIGPDPSGYGQPVCTQGGATGNGCGGFRFGGPRPGIVAAVMPSWQPGDDGAPITVDGQLVGMTREGHTGIAGAGIPRLSTFITFTFFSAILGAVNAKGGPGAGFTPIPA